MRLDSRDVFPSGMEEYLSNYDWHFSKKMCEWACSKMYKTDSSGRRSYIDIWNKEEVDKILSKYGLTLLKETGYDSVYVMNMARADYLGSSIKDEQHLALFVKDYIDDGDGYDTITFTRFYADCIGKGVVINWEDMI